jgi:hypothetical protein
MLDDVETIQQQFPPAEIQRMMKIQEVIVRRGIRTKAMSGSSCKICRRRLADLGSRLFGGRK